MNSHGALGLALATALAALGVLALTAAPAFAAPQTLKVSVTGSGQVNDSLGLIVGCEEAAGSCEAAYEEGTSLTLYAAHNERTAFAGWTGCETENGAECTLTIGAAATEVSAEFEPIPQQTLTVAATGPGIVTGTSPGAEFTPIECSEGASTCEATYNQGATLILFANHSERTAFAGWTNCPNILGPTECEVTLTAATEVAAEFEPLTQEALTVTTTEGTGTGTVSGSQPGGEFTPINCVNGTETCTAEYNQGATVILTANRATHSKFTGWEGCTNVLSTNEFTASECEVNMTAATEVKAKFASITQANLKVEVTGAGEVASSPPGIACTSASSPCTEHFDTEGPEATVTLTPSSAQFNHFQEWEGACTGEGACEVTMSAAKSVKADFAATFHTLTVSPTGSGSVSAASGITGCEEGVLVFPQTCAGSYQEGSTLTLTADPGAHHHVAWSGCTHESGDTCEVVIGPSDQAAGAAFPINTHTLTVSRTGLGSITASTGPISACSAAGGTCSGVYDETSTVTLTATPAAHKYVRWEGCTHESADTCEVEIGPAATLVKAAFPGNPQTLTVAPAGQGTVRATSGSIRDCSASAGTCSGTYIEAATAILLATPGPGQAVAWQGCTALPAPDTCEVEIGPAQTTVKAAFAPIAHTLSLDKVGTGQGTVTCNGVPCASSYPAGTALALAATPATGSTFAGWSGGACSGTGTCHLTLNADTTLTATFNANPLPPIEEVKKPPPLKCHKGFVKKNGRCVRKPKPRHHKKKR